MLANSGSIRTRLIAVLAVVAAIMATVALLPATPGDTIADRELGQADFTHSTISQIDVDELFTVIEKAQQMGIIVPSSEGPEKPFTFSHELVRQTLLADIATPRQQQLHSRVADAIEQLYPGAVNEHAADIADHIFRAGSFASRQRLVRWLTLAGKHALESAAFQEAQRNFRSALSHQGAIEPHERADLLAGLAMAERGLDRWSLVVTPLREALDIYMKLQDRGTVARTVNELTDALIWSVSLQEATA